LLLFGQLFQRVADLPGFDHGSYLAYLTPGVVVMTAMSTAGWSGTAIVQDLERGVMERTLASPVRRGALTLSSLLHQGFVTVVQTLILLGVAVLAGARFGGGAGGVAVLVACSVLLGAAFAALSDAIAVLVRQQEALIAVSQFLTLPLTFLSSVMLAPALMPSWVAAAARFNPVDWAAVAGRAALGSSASWSVVGPRGVLLLALAAVVALLARWTWTVQRRAA